MAAAHAEIQVYASFPRVVALGTDLNLDADNWHWVLCLSFPIKTLNVLQFSHRPYKWIRYAIGVVVGAEGDLSSSPDSLNIMDYNAGLQNESATFYYHTNDDERRRTLPADPNMRTNETSSIATSGGARFRFGVAARDGNQCVLTGMEEGFCDAVHLLAHSKGDTYISMYTHHRNRDPSSGDHVQDIHSVRNGLFLNKFTHAGLGKYVAFLPTPNFAMDTSDVDPTAPAEEKRYTTHLFEPSKPLFLGSNSTSSGTPLRISDTSDWPPAVLFDVVYASSVIHHFGAQTLKDEVTVTWKDIYYPVESGTAITERLQKRALRRQAYYEAHSGPDIFDILLALPYILVPPDELQASLREAKEKAAVAEQKRVQEKVDTWKRQIDAP